MRALAVVSIGTCSMCHQPITISERDCGNFISWEGPEDVSRQITDDDNADLGLAHHACANVYNLWCEKMESSELALWRAKHARGEWARCHATVSELQAAPTFSQGALF